MAKTRREPTRGYYARRAIAKARRLISELQRDLMAVAVAAGRNDMDRLEKALRGVMAKHQQIGKLLTAALTGDYEGLGLEDSKDAD